MSFHIIVASYNRVNITTRALRAVMETFEEDEYSVTLYDDGSRDGTATAVRELIPKTRILSGNGSAYWAKSMAMAEESVLAHPATLDTDFIVWLNDDVELDSDALRRIKPVLIENPECVVVGAVRDPISSLTTYSGFVRRGLHPLSFAIVDPTSDPQAVDTLNGNFVLVPVSVARRMGGIERRFAHALADIDYGLRCGGLGIDVILAPGSYGRCAKNPPLPKESLIASWRRFLSAKGGGHRGSMHLFLERHSGNKWILFMLYSYIGWWVKALRNRIFRVV